MQYLRALINDRFCLLNYTEHDLLIYLLGRHIGKSLTCLFLISRIHSLSIIKLDVFLEKNIR